MSRSTLARLFEPSSIAIVGASTAPDKVGYQLVDALRTFAGAVYPINPKALEVAGRRAYPSLSAVPQVPDLAVLAVPAAACPQLIADAAKLGIGAALIVSGGFVESGEAGARLQAEMANICRTSDLRLLGPNTSGFTRPGAGCHACFVPATQDFVPGSLGIVAQSGGVNLTLSFLAQERGLGLRLAVGLGNSVDVDAADVVEYMAGDEGTDVICVHLEGVRNGRRLYEAVAAATELKPVIAMPVGRQDVGDFARSHTGNLLGPHEVTASALRQAGAIVVNSTEATIDSAAAFMGGRLPPKEHPGVGLLTGQAGPGLIIFDALRALRVDVPKLSEGTVEQLSKHLPPMTYMRNPVDTGRPSPAFADVLLGMSRDPSLDAFLIFALDEPAALDAVTVFHRVRESVSAPMLFASQGPTASVNATAARLRGLSIPTFTSPEQSVRGIHALVADAKARYRRSRDVETIIDPERRGLSARNEAELKRMLAERGIPSPKAITCQRISEAEAAYANLRKPIAVKVLDASIKHKTEVGGVHLDVATMEALRTALFAIDAIPGTGPRQYLLEEMAPDGVELIVGAKRDASFGVTVLVGLGGVQAEALRDVSIRLAPLPQIEVQEMLEELRGKSILDGWRGSPGVDRSAVVSTVLALAGILLGDPSIQELEINPLRCLPDGVLALDAVVAISEVKS